MGLRVLTVFCLMFSLIPSAVKSFHSDCAGNPLSPISTGNSQDCHTFSLHSSIRCTYFGAFLSWASSHQVSQGAVSSIMMMAFPFSDYMSGRNVLWIMFGKISLLSRNCSHLPIICYAKDYWLCFFGFTWWRLSFSNEVDGLARLLWAVLQSLLL